MPRSYLSHIHLQPGPRYGEWGARLGFWEALELLHTLLFPLSSWWALSAGMGLCLGFLSLVLMGYPVECPVWCLCHGVFLSLVGLMGVLLDHQFTPVGFDTACTHLCLQGLLGFYSSAHQNEYPALDTLKVIWKPSHPHPVKVGSWVDFLSPHLSGFISSPSGFLLP